MLLIYYEINQGENPYSYKPYVNLPQKHENDYCRK